MKNNSINDLTADTIQIAIRIENPARVSARFGEEAGDYSPDECRYWVGTRSELYPAAHAPGPALVIDLPVKWAGASAWVDLDPAAFSAAILTRADRLQSEAVDARGLGDVVLFNILQARAESLRQAIN